LAILKHDIGKAIRNPQVFSVKTGLKRGRNSARISFQFCLVLVSKGESIMTNRVIGIIVAVVIALAVVWYLTSARTTAPIVAPAPTPTAPAPSK
jgi:hypothetical protein